MRQTHAPAALTSASSLRGSLVIALIALCGVGCGTTEPAEGSWTTVGDGWSDLGTTSDSAASGDSAAADDGGASDALADTSGAADTALADAGAAGPADSGAVDSGVVDSGAADTANMDTGSADTGSAADGGAGDGGSGNLCTDKANAYKAAKVKALACSSDFQCYAPSKLVEGEGFTFGAPDQIGCSCNRYYSDQDLAGQSLADLNGEFKKAGCTAACPKIACPDLTKQIGVCDAGACKTTTASCKEMEALVASAVTEGRKCSADADCSGFGMQGSLPCGCPVNVNLKTLAPGKPLFLYITMVTRAYTNLGCAKGVTCSCAPVGKGACVKGMCVTKK